MPEKFEPVENQNEDFIQKTLENNPELERIYRERQTTSEIVPDELGRISRDGQIYIDSPRMRAFIEIADAIRESIPKVDDGHVRLWRGNRKSEVGCNPSYTNSLEGIALPFLTLYGGVLSYVDVSKDDAKKFLLLGDGSASDSEFMLSVDVAKNVEIVGFTPEEADELKNNAVPESKKPNRY